MYYIIYYSNYCPTHYQFCHLWTILPSLVGKWFKNEKCLPSSIELRNIHCMTVFILKVYFKHSKCNPPPIFCNCLSFILITNLKTKYWCWKTQMLTNLFYIIDTWTKSKNGKSMQFYIYILSCIIIPTRICAYQHIYPVSCTVTAILASLAHGKGILLDLKSTNQFMKMKICWFMICASSGPRNPHELLFSNSCPSLLINTTFQLPCFYGLFLQSHSFVSFFSLQSLPINYTFLG